MKIWPHQIPKMVITVNLLFNSIDLWSMLHKQSSASLGTRNHLPLLAAELAPWSLTAELAISLVAKLLAISTRRPVHASCAVFQTLTFLYMVLCVHIFDEGIF